MADAAITVLAARGSRGLSHRAVDRELGIAEGSTSVYFRTREALLIATGHRIVERDLEVTGAIHMPPRSRREAAERIVAMIAATATGEHRDRRLARYELDLEARAIAPLREAFTRARDAYVAEAERLMDEAGCEDAAAGAPLLAVCINGLIIDHLLRDGPAVPLDRLAEHVERILDAY